MSREAHAAEVAAAIEMLREISDIAVGMKEKQQEALAVIEQATGGSECPVDGGRNAFEYTAVLGQRIEEFATICDNSTASLNMYLQGF
jgi:hypothetical protein